MRSSAVVRAQKEFIVDTRRRSVQFSTAHLLIAPSEPPAAVDQWPSQWEKQADR